MRNDLFLIALAVECKSKPEIGRGEKTRSSGSDEVAMGRYLERRASAFSPA
jgi:hypothetical protein